MQRRQLAPPRPFQFQLRMALFVMCVASAIIPTGLWYAQYDIHPKTVCVTAIFGWAGVLLLIGLGCDQFSDREH